MNKSEIIKLLQSVQTGKTDVETALKRLKHMPLRT